MCKKNKRKYICFDRDGTINEEVLYLAKAEDVSLYPEVIPALKKLSAAGYGIIIVTNQSGIGRGYYSENDMHSVNKRIEELLGAEGIELGAFYFCPHLPEDGCDCRKPLSGMIDAAVRDFDLVREEVIVVGDKICDVELGQNAGGRGILVRTGHGCEVELERERVVPDYVCDNLSEAVDWIIGD